MDLSTDMLTRAFDKAQEMENPPMFLHGNMADFTLPEPVDVLVCMLDSFNYMAKPEQGISAISCFAKALRPGGMLIFDVRPPEQLRAFDGQMFMDETEDVVCIWRTEFDEEENCCYYGIDLFRRRGALWARSFEQHCEYAYDPDTLEQWLREAGFARVECFGDRTLTPPGPDEQRMYFAAWKE